MMCNKDIDPERFVEMEKERKKLTATDLQSRFTEAKIVLSTKSTAFEKELEDLINRVKKKIALDNKLGGVEVTMKPR